MSVHFLEGETERVECPDGEWIEIKQELSQDDQDFIMGRMVTVGGGKGKSDVQFKVGRMATLERAVVKWSFPEPINADTLSRLRGRYREMILAKIDELSVAQSSWLTKNSKTAS